MDEVAFLLGLFLLGLWRHANGDPARFSQYHSGFFKAGLPRRRVHRRNPFALAETFGNVPNPLCAAADLGRPSTPRSYAILGWFWRAGRDRRWQQDFKFSGGQQ